MDIDNFTLPNSISKSKFKYGIKFIPERVLNKKVDYILIIIKTEFDNSETYSLCFRKGSKFINVELNYKDFKEYKEFLEKCGKYIYCNNNIDEVFKLHKQRKNINIKSLNNEYFKLSCRKEDGNIFFSLGKDELEEFIQATLTIFRERNIVNKLHDVRLDFLSVENKNELYLKVLYVLLDNALDLKDKKRFNVICREINKLRNR